MTPSQLASVLSQTDATDRDLLDRLITRYSYGQTGTRRLAQTFSLDAHEVFARFERMRILGLVDIMRNGNYDSKTKMYDAAVPGPTIGWFYNGGPISEFFEYYSSINFA